MSSTDESLYYDNNSLNKINNNFIRRVKTIMSRYLIWRYCSGNNLFIHKISKGIFLTKSSEFLKIEFSNSNLCRELFSI